MNKKQWITAWITLILICGLFIFSPRRYYYGFKEPFVEISKVEYDKVMNVMPSTENGYFEVKNWHFILAFSLLILIFCGLLTYGLMDKKKK
jgi:hypothetical protein